MYDASSTRTLLPRLCVQDRDLCHVRQTNHLGRTKEAFQTICNVIAHPTETKKKTKERPSLSLTLSSSLSLSLSFGYSFSTFSSKHNRNHRVWLGVPCAQSLECAEQVARSPSLPHTYPPARTPTRPRWPVAPFKAGSRRARVWTHLYASPCLLLLITSFRAMSVVAAVTPKLIDFSVVVVI